MIKKRWGTSGLLKGYLFLGVTFIALGSFLYTQSLIRQLEEPVKILSRIIAEFYTQAGSPLLPEASMDTDIIFEEVIQKVNFPVVFTDEKGIPQAWRNIGVDPESISREELMDVDPENPPGGSIGRMFKIVSRLDRENVPIPIEIEGAGVLGYVHYGESEGVKILRWAPFIQLFVISLFAFLGFIGFRTVRRSEENYIWLGMAKETAHQLGTPLSSLMGWVEVMRDKGKGKDLPKELSEVMEEMEKDISRLQGITSRFNKIGSPPSYEEQDILPLIQEACQYYRGRIPRFGKNVQIIEPKGPIPPVKVDGEILSWALENLIKNGLDAISERDGSIEVTAESNGQWLEVRVKDTGRGLNRDEKRKIFTPGYSTKKFGWGLGLPLAKRIIENYHSGRLVLESSQPGEGSIFAISLPLT
jgi:hypothetical protein